MTGEVRTDRGVPERVVDSAEDVVGTTQLVAEQRMVRGGVRGDRSDREMSVQFEVVALFLRGAIRVESFGVAVVAADVVGGDEVDGDAVPAPLRWVSELVPLLHRLIHEIRVRRDDNRVGGVGLRCCERVADGGESTPVGFDAGPVLVTDVGFGDAVIAAVLGRR